MERPIIAFEHFLRDPRFLTGESGSAREFIHSSALLRGSASSAVSFGGFPNLPACQSRVVWTTR
jgi:hypothetical protein